LIENGSDGRYLPSGHVLYLAGATLMAVPVDLTALSTTGPPVPVIRDAFRVGAGTTQSAASENGTLVYVSAVSDSTVAQRVVTKVAADGSMVPLAMTPGPFQKPRVSPDRKWVALEGGAGTETDIWIADMAGHEANRRLTFGGRNRFPVWSPDGQFVAFSSDRDGVSAIYRQHADGTGAAEALAKATGKQEYQPESWALDGSDLVLSIKDGATYTAGALSLRDRIVRPLPGITSVAPLAMSLSPDGEWIAYAIRGAQALRATLFVQPYPLSGTPYQIGIGIHPFWLNGGRRLGYDVVSQLSYVDVTPGARFAFGPAHQFNYRLVTGGPGIGRNFDGAGDSIIGLVEQSASGGNRPVPLQLNIVLNWFTELNVRVPRTVDR